MVHIEDNSKLDTINGRVYKINVQYDKFTMNGCMFPTVWRLKLALYLFCLF